MLAASVLWIESVSESPKNGNGLHSLILKTEPDGSVAGLTQCFKSLQYLYNIHPLLEKRRRWRLNKEKNRTLSAE
jgi:hypothetical protein